MNIEITSPDGFRARAVGSGGYLGKFEIVLSYEGFLLLTTKTGVFDTIIYMLTMKEVICNA